MKISSKRVLYGFLILVLVAIFVRLFDRAHESPHTTSNPEEYRSVKEDKSHDAKSVESGDSTPLQPKLFEPNKKANVPEQALRDDSAYELLLDLPLAEPEFDSVTVLLPEIFCWESVPTIEPNETPLDSETLNFVNKRNARLSRFNKGYFDYKVSSNWFIDRDDFYLRMEIHRDEQTMIGRGHRGKTVLKGNVLFTYLDDMGGYDSADIPMLYSIALRPWRASDFESASLKDDKLIRQGLSEKGKAIDVKVVELAENAGKLYFEKQTGRLVRVETDIYGHAYGHARVCADMDGFVDNARVGDTLPMVLRVYGIPRSLIQAPISEDKFDGILQMQIDPNEGIHLHDTTEWTRQ